MKLAHIGKRVEVTSYSPLTTPSIYTHRERNRKHIQCNIRIQQNILILNVALLNRNIKKGELIDEIFNTELIP